MLYLSIVIHKIIYMSKEKKKPKRRILKGHIQYLSLCPKGANTISTVYKADDGENKSVSFTSAVKEMNEQGELIACVYSPELVDSQGDVASAKVIKQMAYDFAKEGFGIDIKHDGQVIPKEEAFIAQSMVIDKGDSRFSGMKNYDGDVVDVTDGWGVIIKVEDERLRDLYRTGMWGGISMGGFMMVGEDEYEESEKKESVIAQALKSIENYLSKNKINKNTEIEDMDSKEFKAILEENNKSLSTSIATAVKEALTPQETEAQKAERLEKEVAEKAGKAKKGLGYTKPVLKENPTQADIDQYEKKLEIYELSKAVDPDSVQSVREFQIAAKEIATGKKVETKKEDTDAYGSYFSTNQDASLSNGSEDATEKAMLELVEKAETTKR